MHGFTNTGSVYINCTLGPVSSLKVSLHIPNPCPSPSPSLSKFSTVSMVDGQNGPGTYSACQGVRHHRHNVYKS